VHAAATAAAGRAERGSALAAACAAAGFDDIAAFRAALLAREQTDALDARLAAFTRDLAGARARAAATATAAEGLSAPDLAALERAAAEASAAQDGAQREAGGLRERLAARDALLDSIAEAGRDREAAEAAWRVAEDLSELARGQNRQRLSLEGFVLRSLLDEALAAANRRLRTMLAGRYAVRRVEEPERRNAAVGLDIEVLDEWTGQVRPAGTLSGGEGFCAALALALGLADTVQAHAGARRIDALFVDEGFGTLDPEALETAMAVLGTLQGGERLVGVISHVPELRDRIAARLEVTPGRRGSAAAFRVG
jgi:exonuclease SbcC